jgi:hypothetical protein
MKARIPARVAEALRWSDAWSNPASTDVKSRQAIRIVLDVQARKDGSRHVILTDAEAAIIREYVETLAVAARDDAGHDADARADLNAARAAERALTRKA